MYNTGTVIHRPTPAPTGKAGAFIRQDIVPKTGAGRGNGFVGCQFGPAMI